MTAVAAVVRTLTGPRRRQVLGALLFVVFGLTTTSGTLVVNDVRASSSAAWSLATHGTLDLGSVGFPDIDWGETGRDGGVYPNRFPGGFLPAVPAYVLAPERAPEPGDPYSIPIWPASLTAAALAAAAVTVLHEVLREVLPARQALGSTLVAGLGTSVWTVAADALWTHSSGILLLALTMRALQQGRHWYAGAWLGFAITVRPTHAFTALGVGLTLAATQRAWQRLVQIGAPSALGLGVLAVYSKVLFDTWLPVAGYRQERVGAILGVTEARTGPFSWSDQILGTLFDAYHGVLPYSPFLVLCVAFLVVGWRRSPDWARAMLVGGVVYWYAQLRGNAWPGGYNFFGYRFPIEPLWASSTVLALAWFAAVRHRWARMLGLVLVTVSLTINALGAIMFGARYEPNRPGYERVGPALVDE